MATDSSNVPESQASETASATPATADPLALGGRLDQLLAASDPKMSLEYSKFASHHRSITDDLARLRNPTLPHFTSLDCDPVFQYTVAAVKDKEDSRDFWYDKAYWPYLHYKEAYDFILKDLIPADLREDVELELAHRAFESGANKSAADDVDVYLRRLDERAAEIRQSGGVSTGIEAIDEAVGGALRGLVFLGGGTFVGKTSLALHVLLAALRANERLAVVFVSLDMGKDRLFDRLLCHESGVALSTLLNWKLSAEAVSQLDDAISELRKDIFPRLRIVEPLVMDSRGTDFVKRVVVATRELKSETNATQLLLIVDYFQLIEVRDLARHDDLDRHRMRMLKQIQNATATPADPTGSPMLVVSEVRKGDSGRKSIGIDDLMGSARLSYGPDTVLLLQRSQDYSDASSDNVPLTLKVAKCRDGGKLTEIGLNLETQTMRFSAVAPTDSHADRSWS